MSEIFIVPNTTNRKEIYKGIYPQIKALVEHETDLIANLANVVAALKEAFGFFWIGFYIKKENQLVLGPFQGPIACTRINFNRGVCGHAYSTKKTVVVPNVDEFPGHIACSDFAKSEIVVPLFDENNEVWAVLDVDSDVINDFSQVDADGLEKIMKLLKNY